MSCAAYYYLPHLMEERVPYPRDLEGTEKEHCTLVINPFYAIMVEGRLVRVMKCLAVAIMEC